MILNWVLSCRFIETAMTNVYPPEVGEFFVDRTPQGRSGKPEEIAKVAAFLCSEGASYMNGAIGESLDASGIWRKRLILE
jgi:3-oxoacyl-[acyl-carrier protein] reductase